MAGTGSSAQEGNKSGVTTEQVAGAVAVGAVSGAAASIFTLVYNNAKDRQDRHREHFSQALRVVVLYEEFPYVVRRRRASQPEEERIRISTELRQVQADLSYHCAWLMTESNAVGKSYAALVTELRRLAGTLIHEAWLTPPIGDDPGMNIPDIGPTLGALTTYKQAYLLEVTDHLSLFPRWLRRAVRWRPWA